MNIKPTPWETRNLGVKSSVEYYFERDDLAGDIGEDVLNNKKHAYQIAHVAVGRTDVLNKLIESGFTFAETKIELTADLKHLVLPATFQRFAENLSYHTASQEETNQIYQTMEDGVFATDKVALDPMFNANIAGHRYRCWTEDIVKAGTGFLHVVNSGEEKLGFFVLKKSSERLGDSFLAGLFDKNKSLGLGFSVLYYPMVEAKRMGLKKMITGVSSNNPDSVKMHLVLGYRIKNMDYTLVKHVKEEA